MKAACGLDPALQTMVSHLNLVEEFLLRHLAESRRDA